MENVTDGALQQARCKGVPMGVVDTMVVVLGEGPHPAPYLFSRVDAGADDRPYAERLLAEMDRYDVEVALVPVDNPTGASLVGDHADRFVGEWPVVLDDVGALRRAVTE